MILEEKAVMTHAQSKFSSPGVLRLGIPENWMSDGLINEKGKKLFSIYGAKIYKGRWVMNNTFSYPKEHKPKFE